MIRPSIRGQFLENRQVDVLFEHANWLIALLSFYLAFRGIVLKHVDASAPLPWYFFPTDRNLHGASAVFVGCLYLVAGIIAIFSVWPGVAALLGTTVVAWVYGLSRPTL